MLNLPMISIAASMLARGNPLRYKHSETEYIEYAASSIEPKYVDTYCKTDAPRTCLIDTHSILQSVAKDYRRILGALKSSQIDEELDGLCEALTLCAYARLCMNKELESRDL